MEDYMGILTYNDRAFLMDGKEYTIISGAMHYFRIPSNTGSTDLPSSRSAASTPSRPTPAGTFTKSTRVSSTLTECLT